MTDGLRRVRALTPEQVDQLVALFADEWWTAGRSRAQVGILLEHSLVFALVDDDERLAAFARVLSDRVAKALVFDVIVAPEQRGRGAGAALMDWLLYAPAVADARHVELYCLPGLEPFYARWGFSREVGGVALLRRG